MSWSVPLKIEELGVQRLVDVFRGTYFKSRRNLEYVPELEHIVQELARRPLRETIRFVPYLTRLMRDAAKKEEFVAAGLYRDMILYYRTHV